MPAPDAPLPVRMKRDQRLDMFRGLALLMIFVNHVPNTLYDNFTSRNFGFSDAAEAFVLMSGIAAGLAYSPRFADGGFWPGALRIWARARTLYFTHVATTLMALAVFAAAGLWLGVPELLLTNNIEPLFQHPLQAIIGLPTLLYQLGYFNILPLYIILLLLTPLAMPLALRHPTVLLGFSIFAWACAGQFRLNLPTYPSTGGWFFNPFAWQLLFVVGLLGGVAAREGRTFLPQRQWMVWASGAFVVLVVLWMRIEEIGDAGRHALGWLSGLGLPFYVTWFDKPFLALPRLLYVLALAYFLVSLPIVRQIAESEYARPLTLLGRHGLPVFALGSVLSFVLQATKAITGRDDLIDGALLLGGIGLLPAFAYALEIMRRPERLSPRRTSAATGEVVLAVEPARPS